jgi:hypothetical protein
MTNGRWGLSVVVLGSSAVFLAVLHFVARFLS